jgi:hypothetical protein
LLEVKVRLNSREFAYFRGLPRTGLPPPRVYVEKDPAASAQVLFDLLLQVFRLLGAESTGMDLVGSSGSYCVDF